MHTHIDKTPDNKSTSTPDSLKEPGKEAAFQFMDQRPAAASQRKLQAAADRYVQRKTNGTGLPDNLKSGVEELSGYSLDDVNVHYNSDKPGRVQAHAYARGTDIHLAPGQEQHLPHEAWHVIQQKQGRVKPTMQLKGTVPINDDAGLEKEADVMGAKAMQLRAFSAPSNAVERIHTPFGPVIQRTPWSFITEAAGYVGWAAGAVTGGVKGLWNKENDTGIYESIMESGRQGAEEGYEDPTAAVTGLAGAGLMALAGPALPLTGAATVLGGAVGSFLGPLVKKQIMPLKTEITHTTGFITLTNLDNDGQTTKHPVGKKMVAKLDANDAVQGSATGVNWTWMQHLRKQYPQANIVRGHLLNHDLGGFGMPGNLYPISTKANQQHSELVEQPVKTLLRSEYTRRSEGKVPKRLNYIVEVEEDSSSDPESARFVCKYYFDGETPVPVSIPSDLRTDKGGFGGLHTNPLGDTDWAHGDRKGFQDPDVAESLEKAKTKGKIILHDLVKHRGVEENVNAVYTPGTEESLLLIFGNMMHSVFNRGAFEKRLKVAIALNLSDRRATDFEKVLLDTIRRSASYNDNRGDMAIVEELIIQIVAEQLDVVAPSFYREQIDDAKRQLDAY